MRQARDLFVLFCHALCSVDHDDADVASLDGRDCAYNAETLDILRHLFSASDARGIDQCIFLTFMLERRIDSVARRSRDIADDDALFSDHSVDQRGFSYIRLADDCDLDILVLFFCLAALWKLSDDKI